MREIKFRALDPGTDKWLYFTLTKLICGHGRHNLRLKNWCEYTGLNDKNGKEIYEGDICRAAKSFICSISIDLYRGVIMTWAYMNARSKLVENMVEPMWRNHEVSLEVIGNIYENPELLKEGK